MAAQADLFGHGERVPARAPRVWTPEEQKTKLVGYMLVPPEMWPNLRKGTHVRYYTKEGEFKTGGFVVQGSFDSQGGERFLKLASNYDSRAPGCITWVVNYAGLEQVHGKLDFGAVLLQASHEAVVEKTNRNFQRLAEYTKGLEARIEALERRR